MSKSKIEWTDRVWNPVTGCTPISPGCDNCYAEGMSKRFAETWGLPVDNPFKVTLHTDRLGQPLHWKKPSKVFICSMSDLFHESVPDSYLDEVFGVILASEVLINHRRHTYLMLTKRPERMHSYLANRTPAELLKAWAEASNWITLDDPDMCFDEVVYSACCHDWDENGRNSSGSEYKPWGYTNKLFPLPNLWLGVTAENQEQADKRIPILLQIPAVVRFVSVEPMLGRVDINRWMKETCTNCGGIGRNPNHPHVSARVCQRCKGAGKIFYPRLDWVICGGESGPGARPMHPDWVRSLRDQCKAAGVPFFFKQWGEWCPEEMTRGMWHENSSGDIIPSKHFPVHCWPGGDGSVKVGKKKAGCLLDGQEWRQFPEV